MSGEFSTNAAPSGLLGQVLDQWKLWIVAAIAVTVVVTLATYTEETFFHQVWFALLAVGSVLYALWNVDAVSVTG